MSPNEGAQHSKWGAEQQRVGTEADFTFSISLIVSYTGAYKRYLKNVTAAHDDETWA